MEYLLITISWLLRTYGAIQEERTSINTPLIWQSGTAKTILLIVWILLLLISLYLVFVNSGVLLLLIVLVSYFLVVPALFGRLFKQIIDKLGF